MAGERILSLDVGTSSCRASLYDDSARRLPGSGDQITYAPVTTAEGGAEMDPDVLFDLVCQAVDAVAARAGALDGVVGVACTTFWHGLMGVDGDGRPATPLYLWVDARSRQDAEALKRRLDERAVHARTGCVLHWSYWPAKLTWLARTQPVRSAAVARWVSFGEYLTFRLFGRWGVSVSMASGTGLLDQHTCEWDRRLLADIGVEPGRLSPIVRLGDPFQGLLPAFATRWPALTMSPWVAAVGDGATSNIGAGCTTRERFALMVGTSTAMRVVWRAPEFTVPWGTWCYRADQQRVVMGGAMNDGGSLIDWLVRSLVLPALPEAEREVSTLEPDGHGLTVMPFWAGERSTGWAADATGAILGLRLHTRPIEILRAAMEAVAIRFALLEDILAEVVPEAREVVATGGALLHSPVWMQIMADALGRPLLASSEPEASSRGAALLVLEALGQLEAPLESLLPGVSATYVPDPAATARYRAAAERQQRYYRLLVADRLAPSPGGEGGGEG